MEAQAIAFGMLLVGVIAFLSWVVSRLPASTSSRQTESHFVRGRVLTEPPAAAHASSEAAPPSSQFFVRWGGAVIPAEEALRHFACIGASGSGKSITIKSVMRDVCPGMEREHSRAICLDMKPEYLSYLASMHVRFKTLQPLDARSYSWAMGRDIADEDTAREVAAILIPDGKKGEGGQRYFHEAARDLLAGVLIALRYLAVEQWDLQDVLNIVRTPESLKAGLSACPDTVHLVSQHMTGAETTFRNVYSTLSVAMNLLKTVGAAWRASADAGRSLGLADWVRDSVAEVLVLGSDDTRRATIEPINRVLFKRLSSLLLAPEEPRTRQPRTWVFLDELTEVKLDGVRLLSNQGRARGVVLVVGFQSIEAMQDQYGDKEALAFLANFANRAFYRVESQATADHISGLVGDAEIEEPRYQQSESQSKQGSSMSSSTTMQKGTARVFLPSELLTLAPASPATGLTGLYLTRAGAWVYTTPASQWPPETVEGTSDFVPRPKSELRLSRFSVADVERLGLSEYLDDLGVDIDEAE